MKLYNTLTRTKEEFTPITPGQVSLYTCGPTVYNYAHIGNLRTYIFEDLLRRTLEANQFTVNHVMNITDVGHLTDDGNDGEDKMEKGAARENKTVWEIAEHYTNAFQSDMAALHITEPTMWCKATDHIQEQIDMVQQLENNGHTYTTSDGVYFDTSTFPTYGEMAKLDIEGLQEGSRVEMGEKKNATDFALWKFSPNAASASLGEPTTKRQMEWESPWGVGFPGWHVECSAMSLKYLGNHFDIHCGGIDHIPIHHTNEIAQNEGVVGKQTVNTWMHGEFLLTNDERMGKSKGNFLTVQSLVDKQYDPLAYRYFVVGAHYRSMLNFTFEALDGAASALNKLRQQVRLWVETGEADASPDETTIQQFMDAMNNDLDTPAALAVVWDMVKSDSAALTPAVKLATLFKLDTVLGFGLQETAEEFTASQSDVPAEITEKLAARETARANKEWATSDTLRDEIQAAGYTIEDTPNGARVFKV